METVHYMILLVVLMLYLISTGTLFWGILKTNTFRDLDIVTAISTIIWTVATSLFVLSYNL